MSELIYPIDSKEFFFKLKNRISVKDAKIITEKYQNGCSLRDIAKLLGCSKGKVCSELKRHGLEPRQSATQATNLRSLKSGKQSAKPFFGFCYFEGEIIKDPREYPVLEVIHRCWSQGKTIHQINLELNKAKVPSRTGRVWSWAAIQNIVNRFKVGKVIITKGGNFEFR